MFTARSKLLSDNVRILGCCMSETLACEPDILSNNLILPRSAQGMNIEFTDDNSQCARCTRSLKFTVVSEHVALLYSYSGPSTQGQLLTAMSPRRRGDPVTDYVVGRLRLSYDVDGATAA
jgi:hypothetical protein